ncbi:ATP-dependent RNA helicase DBP5 [Thamnidium elegans]|nr:ATP-dependent RNA helicase DBP5 [Thamnidium elegans]
MYSSVPIQTIFLFYRNEGLLRGLYTMSYTKPSKIQKMAIPLILANPPRNLIAQSQNGTGKTAAFVLAMLKRIDPDLKQTQAICLAPSRELARQMLDFIQEVSKYLTITSAGILRDVFKPTARASLNKNQMLTDHIVVGTPGTILNCLRKRHTINVNHIKMFVLDEADNMLDYQGLGDQSIRIRNLIPVQPQILLFSATFPDYVCRFARRFAPDPHEIMLKVEELSVSSIGQCYMDCINEEQKYNVVCNIYDVLTVSQSIIFCKRRKSADVIARKMRELGHLVNCIHGEMTPDERDVIIDDFRRGIFKVLVTTNLISRGIDITSVSLVINYDMPLDRYGNPDAEVYLHRIGRTGRFGHTGVSIIFVHDETTYRHMKYIEDYFKVKIRRIPTEDWQEIEKIFKQYI